MNTRRNRFAHAVANWVLNTFATEEYTERLNYVYVLGAAELERRNQGDLTEGRLFHD